MPRRALTAASVERIKPPATGQLEYFDAGYPGLALRVSYGGSRSFVYFYRTVGRLRRMTLGQYPAMSLSEAREAWRKARQDVLKGRDPAQGRKREKPATDFANAAREWLKRDRGKRTPRKESSKREMERIVERELIPAWGNRAVGSIGKRDVIELVEAIADRGAVTMARRVQAYIHRFFKWAMSRDIGVEANPATGLVMPGNETQRDRVLTDAELVAVWNGAEKIGWPFGAIIKLLILTGSRREEITGLLWSEISDDEFRLEGARTKSSAAHVIPLSTPAVAIVKALPKINGEGDFVFTITGRTPVSGWSRIKSDLDADIGIAPWRVHDLRRTVSTGMNEIGVEPHVVEAVLGHTVKGVAGTYNRAKHEAAKRAAAVAWGAHVMALVEGQQPDKVLPLRGKR